MMTFRRSRAFCSCDLKFAALQQRRKSITSVRAGQGQKYQCKQVEKSLAKNQAGGAE
ncbi:hypothetical protein [Rhizobium mongolense]|uniref:hypothetical protein n=1 Tax=Rhizobium mongolense TaxID=57676 RepID=UPI001428CB6B|nr:hypothetical protein [Rhizobium mongolense]